MENKQLDVVESFISGAKSKIKRYVSDEQFFKDLLNFSAFELKNNPKLMECPQKSIAKSIISAGVLGLRPGPQQHIHFVPRKKKGVLECCLEVGYRGYITLLMRLPNVSFVDADCIYEGDEILIEKGGKPNLVHRPNINGDRTDQKIIGAYAVLYFNDDDRPKFVFMNRQELQKVQGTSAANGYGPWNDWFGEMAKKTVLKRLSKQIDLSFELSQATHLEDSDNPVHMTIDGEVIEVEESVQEPKKTQTEKTLEILDKK